MADDATNPPAETHQDDIYRDFERLRGLSLAEMLAALAKRDDVIGALARDYLMPAAAELAEADRDHEAWSLERQG